MAKFFSVNFGAHRQDVIVDEVSEKPIENLKPAATTARLSRLDHWVKSSSRSNTLSDYYDKKKNQSNNLVNLERMPRLANALTQRPLATKKDKLQDGLNKLVNIEKTEMAYKPVYSKIPLPITEVKSKRVEVEYMLGKENKVVNNFVQSRIKMQKLSISKSPDVKSAVTMEDLEHVEFICDMLLGPPDPYSTRRLDIIKDITVEDLRDMEISDANENIFGW